MEDAPEQKKPVKRRRKWLIWFTIISLLVLFSVVYFRYYYVYSAGTRVGILYKFSKKGAVFKTYEGEMVLPGMKAKFDKSMSSNLFHFSVTDEKIADTLMKVQGMEIELHYVQYNNGLIWRGETYDENEGQYVVDGFVRVKNENPNGYGL